MKQFHGLSSNAALGSLVAALCVSSIAPAIAAPVQLAQQPNCQDPQTQTEMNICAGLSWQQADRALNRAYQQLLPKLSASRRQKLVDAQLRWITFRDRECDLSGSAAEGGSMQPMLVAGCREQLTQQRTADLQAYLRSTIVAPAGSNQAQADRQLNQLYQQLKPQLSPSRKQKLEKAELAWIRFRDSACEFESTIGGQTARNRCLIRMTEVRSQQLQEYMNLP